MYRCQVCNKVSALHETQATAVVKVKEYEFPERPNVYTYVDETKCPDDPGGVGYQIVKEVRGHEACVRGLQTEVIEGIYRPDGMADSFDPAEYLDASA